MRRPELDTLPEAVLVQRDIFRRMSSSQRLLRGLELSTDCRELAREGVRLRHPEYSDRQVTLAVFRLILPAALFAAAYPDAGDVIP